MERHRSPPSCKYFHRIRSPPDHSWLRLANHILYEPSRAILPRDARSLFLALILSRLQSVSSTTWLRALITPLQPISRGRLRQVRPLSRRSPASLSYLAVFLSKAALKLASESQGTVSSNSTTLVGVSDLSIMTRSGFCSVITRSCGIVPPFVLHPLRSAKTDIWSLLCLMMVSKRWLSTESCLNWKRFSDFAHELRRLELGDEGQLKF